jgi:hypothetical protein
MFTNNNTNRAPVGVYRAIVSLANSTTGEIKVRIPARFGPDTAVTVSKIGRKPVNGVWSVPKIGEQVVVTADGIDFSNVFILNVNPS